MTLAKAMEFERAIFRIHQRTLYSEGMRVSRLAAERWLPAVVLCAAVCLGLLHRDYVGASRCLPPALRRAGLWNATLDAPSVPNDTLLSVVVASDLGVQQAEAAARAVTRGGGAKAAADSGFRIAGENVSALGPGSSPLPSPESVVARYRFAFDREIIQMRPAVFKAHHFHVLNVTIQDSCVASSGLLRELFRTFGAYDNVVINELAYTFRTRGFLERLDGDGDFQIETWAWSAEQVEASSPRDGRGFFGSLVRKVLLLAKSVFAFVLISAVTGFFIRVAVNGSAVLMFPIAILAARFGSGRFSIGLLTRSFPWIGVHTEVLRRANRPLWPLFRSHLVFMFMQSFAYLSCNLAWRFVLYRKSSPEGFEERLFSFCSVIELFNLIYVRSMQSAVVFPRVAFACMVYLHYYMFCSLYPFHVMAFVTCSGTVAYVMAYCLNHYEEPALRGDPFIHTTPTAAHPRATYIPQLSPSWTLEAAPLWTMFYPPDFPSSFPEEAMRHISNEEYLMA